MIRDAEIRASSIIDVCWCRAYRRLDHLAVISGNQNPVRGMI